MHSRGHENDGLQKLLTDGSSYFEYTILFLVYAATKLKKTLESVLRAVEMTTFAFSSMIFTLRLQVHRGTQWARITPLERWTPQTCPN